MRRNFGAEASMRDDRSTAWPKPSVIPGSRFTAFVPIPKGKTGRHRAAPLRSWFLGRRSGRVATVPYPPPRPSDILEAIREENPENQGGRRGRITVNRCISGELGTLLLIRLM